MVLRLLIGETGAVNRKWRTEAALSFSRSPLFFRLIGTAVCTLDSLDRNLAAAERADLGGRLCGCFRLLPSAVSLLTALSRQNSTNAMIKKLMIEVMNAP